MKLSRETLNKIAVAAKLGKDKDIQSAVDSALGEINAKRHWQEEVGEWITAADDGFFSLRAIYDELGTITTKDKGAIRTALEFYKKEDIIEPWKNRGYGWYRKKEGTLIGIDWKKADENPLDIELPLGLGEMVNLYSGDIFIIAGESNTGKTGMCLRIAEMNMHDWECPYFSSELGGAKIKKRISLFETPEEYWEMPTYARHDNYHEALFPNAINIIDFLMITDDFWKVGTKIKEIHLALKETGGIAVIAIQKDPNKQFGRGGDATRELASLYITLAYPGVAKIIKLKDWRTEDNPNHQVCEFKLIDGSKFIQSTPWHDPDGGEWWKK